MSDELKVTTEVMALESELLICGYAGECNQCESPQGRTWAKVSGGEYEEVSEYVCEKCLPAYHAAHLRDLATWEEYAESEMVRWAAGVGSGLGEETPTTEKQYNRLSYGTPDQQRHDCN